MVASFWVVQRFARYKSGRAWPTGTDQPSKSAVFFFSGFRKRGRQNGIASDFFCFFFPSRPIVFFFPFFFFRIPMFSVFFRFLPFFSRLKFRKKSGETPSARLLLLKSAVFCRKPRMFL